MFRAGIEAEILGVKSDNYTITEYKAAMQATEELAAIRKNTKPLPSILGSEPSVKISKKDFNHLMDMAQTSGTLGTLRTFV